MVQLNGFLADMAVVSADVFVGLAFIRLAHAILFSKTRKDKKKEISVQTFLAIAGTRVLHCSSLYCGTHVDPETLSMWTFQALDVTIAGLAVVVTMLYLHHNGGFIVQEDSFGKSIMRKLCGKQFIDGNGYGRIFGQFAFFYFCVGALYLLQLKGLAFMNFIPSNGLTLVESLPVLEDSIWVLCLVPQMRMLSRRLSKPLGDFILLICMNRVCVMFYVLYSYMRLDTTDASLFLFKRLVTDFGNVCFLVPFMVRYLTGLLRPNKSAASLWDGDGFVDVPDDFLELPEYLDLP